MQNAKASILLTSHAGKLWAIGGCNLDENFSKIEVYDPESNSWSISQIETIHGWMRGCKFSSKYFNMN